MAARKKEAIEFPAECCGVCKFSEPTDEDAFLCWGEAPRQHEGNWFRGIPVDPQWPVCHLFKGRCHA